MTPVEAAIIQAIENSGLSNYEIANRLNVSRSLVGRWRKTGKISVEKLGELCVLVNVDANRLLCITYIEEQNLPSLKREVIQLIRQLPKEEDYLLKATKKLLS